MILESCDIACNRSNILTHAPFPPNALEVRCRKQVKLERGRRRDGSVGSGGEAGKKGEGRGK